jgi:putative ABC transport system permease protein
MGRLRKLVWEIRAFFRRDHMRAEADEELRAYLDTSVHEQVRAGLTPEEAHRVARAEMGSIEAIKEAMGDAAWGTTLESLVRDVRYALRALRRSPGFTAVALLSLALGIGATTAILSVINAVLLPRLPYARPVELIDVYNLNLQVASDREEFVSIARWRDWQQRSHSLVDLAAFTDPTAFNLSATGEAVRVRGAAVSANMLGVLGLRPSLGRGFLAEETSLGRNHVVMLSNRLWSTSFHGRREILGQAIQLDRERYTVVGILPPDFQLGTLRSNVDLLLPLALTGPDASRRDRASVDLIGRLKPGVSAEAARADLTSISEQLATLFPETDQGWGVTVVPLRADLEPIILSRLEIFLGLAALLLLVACVNVAVLMIARAESRRQQLRIRAALGASRGQLLRYRVSEALVISCGGGALGVLVSRLGVHALIAGSPPRLFDVTAAPVDGRILCAVLGLSALVTVLLGGLSGLAPTGELTVAVHGVAPRQRWQTVLVGAEIALSLALVAAAGLLAKSLHAISTFDIGFDLNHLAYARVTLDPAMYPSDADRIAFVERLTGDLEGQPLLRVAAGSAAPFGSEWVGNLVQVPGRASHSDAHGLPYCFSAFVLPSFFRTLGNPIVEGRDFHATEAEPVVIINQTFARQLLPGEDPIGRSLMFLPNNNVAYNGAASGLRRIIGVVRDVDENRLSYNRPTSCAAFFPYAQNPVVSIDIFVRSSNEAAAISAVRSEVARLDPAEPLYNVHSERELVDRSLRTWQFQSWFAGLAAAIALLLSAIGVYGTVSHAVRQRTREIGIRMALGGLPPTIIRAMMKEPVWATLGGACLGLFGAWALSQQLASLLFQATAFDPGVFVASAFVLITVGLLAGFLPARRATTLDPLAVLKSE